MTKNLENPTSKKILVRKERLIKCDLEGKCIEIHCGVGKTDFTFLYLVYLTDTESACCVPLIVLSA